MEGRVSLRTIEGAFCDAGLGVGVLGGLGTFGVGVFDVFDLEKRLVFEFVREMEEKPFVEDVLIKLDCSIGSPHFVQKRAVLLVPQLLHFLELDEELFVLSNDPRTKPFGFVFVTVVFGAKF